MSISIQVIGTSRPESHSQPSTVDSGTLNYSIKIVNPKKSDFVVSSKKKFHDLDNLKKRVSEEFEEQINGSIKQIGYIEPGHGLRGKQRWLTSSVELEEMYALFQGRKEIMLWTFSENSKKRSRPENESNDENSVLKKRSRYEGHVDKMAEVDEIYDKLQGETQISV